MTKLKFSDRDLATRVLGIGWNEKDARCVEEEEDNYCYEMDSLTRDARVKGCFPLPASSNNQICFIVSDKKII